ncbi:hypothetical protein, partial [Bacillus subtilis]|uniref:hypothetical protein n=1 Tax=Bacillus subtilis TaxID=1423 RepID=UPI001BDBA212
FNIANLLDLLRTPIQFTLCCRQVTIGGISQLAGIGNVPLKQTVFDVGLLKEQQRTQQQTGGQNDAPDGKQSQQRAKAHFFMGHCSRDPD